METLPTPQLEESEGMAFLEQMASFASLASPKKSSPGKTPESSAVRSNMWRPDLRYRSLVEKLPVVTFMASLDDTVQELYVSPQIETLLGFTQEEWLENPILWYPATASG